MTDWSTHLSAGAHLVPEDGTCLMEAVSRATGDRWTDAPASTHPLLAHLARLVNDAVGDELRDDLSAFIPDLIGTNDPDPAVHARLAAVCVSYALTLEDSPVLRRLGRSAERRLAETLRTESTVLDMIRRWVFEHGPARRAVEESVALCEKRGDACLIGLLAAAASVVRSTVDVSLTAG